VLSRCRTWAILALGAALFGGARGIQAQPLNEPPPQLLAVVRGGPETAANGAMAIFQIQISNYGTTPIRRIVRRDQLPPGLSYLGSRLIEAEVGDGGLIATSRRAFAILARPDDRPNGASPFAVGR
jgi:uncharacterized repeat protein (TIGR01451 family)